MLIHTGALVGPACYNRPQAASPGAACALRQLRDRTETPLVEIWHDLYSHIALARAGRQRNSSRERGQLAEVSSTRPR